MRSITKTTCWTVIGLFLLFACSSRTLLAQATEQATSEPLAHTVDVGVTGFANKRPVFASACPNGCPWGELGDFVHESMASLGYDIVLCRNCNRYEGPRLVATAAYPPPLSPDEISIGTTSRVNARVDFGVTASFFLSQAYRGQGLYARYQGAPFKNLRLIARIEEPYYLMIAVKASSGITDLSQIRERRMPVKILVDGPVSTMILDHYGLTKEAIQSWGGSIGPGMFAPEGTPFDLMISFVATSGPTNNPEAVFWAVTQRADFHFLELPESLLAELAKRNHMERITARWGLLRGVDRPIQTLAWSGNSVFARDDMPETFAYALAKSLDEHHGALKWFIRPYTYDPNTVWQDTDVPLHPGADRYYRERGYKR